MSDKTEQEAGGGLVWTPHPLLDAGMMPALTIEQMGRAVQKPGGLEAVRDYYIARERRIAEAMQDPLRHGMELPHWRDARCLLHSTDELYCLGGNGSGKTEFGAKQVAELLVNEGGRRVLCVTRNEDLSKTNQQAAVWKYLPLHARQANDGIKRRSTIAKLNYSQAGGFTERTFVLPNRSQCWFKTVEQYQRDPTSFEGPEYDMAWIDEPAPVALVETLRYRVGKRAGKLLLTLTAVDGFDAVCRQALEGAKIVTALPMDYSWDLKLETKVPELRESDVQVKGCPAGKMPYILQPIDKRKGVICFWTAWNPFVPTQSLFAKCVGRSKATVRCRLFGWVEKTADSQFPGFNPNVHVLPEDKIPKDGTTLYMSADPAMARSYFMLWMRVDGLGRKFVVAESPSVEEGDWVTADGKRGEGQSLYAGRGVVWYRGYIRERERILGDTATRRKGDPRGFSTQAAAAEGGTSLLDLFREPGDGEDEPMYFEPARVRARIAMEVEVINSALAWDEDKPRSILNEPQLYISERCQNLISALLNWNPSQGDDSPWKDPIDALRYLFDEDLVHLSPELTAPRAGGGF